MYFPRLLSVSSRWSVHFMRTGVSSFLFIPDSLGPWTVPGMSALSTWAEWMIHEWSCSSLTLSAYSVNSDLRMSLPPARPHVPCASFPPALPSGCSVFLQAPSCVGLCMWCSTWRAFCFLPLLWSTWHLLLCPQMSVPVWLLPAGETFQSHFHVLFLPGAYLSLPVSLPWKFCESMFLFITACPAVPGIRRLSVHIWWISRRMRVLWAAKSGVGGAGAALEEAACCFMPKARS